MSDILREFCVLYTFFRAGVCVCVWAVAQVSQRLCRGTVAGGVAVHPQGVETGGPGCRGQSFPLRTTEDAAGAALWGSY